ncbi:MAG: hypothetical protein ACI85I_002353 [Arenicella sp.]|jgi:hypothetical protein
MRNSTNFLLAICILFIAIPTINGQDKSEETTTFATEIFKETRIVNVHSLETTGEGDLNLIIQHRFGRINQGFDQLFGLDQASMRIGLDYGINDRWDIGIGRSTFEKTLDGYMKYRVLRQHETMPFSLTAFTSIAINTTDFPEGQTEFSDSKHRNSYVYQVMVGRKFSDQFSLQLMPSVVHRNLVQKQLEENTIYSLGVASRIQISKVVALNLEYFYVPDNQLDTELYNNAVSIGFDLSTNGHTFQLHFTNSSGMNQKSMITETSDDFFKRDIHFGFNISRRFRVKGKKKW